MNIIARKDARADGLTRYFTGTPCKHGHMCERWTSKGVCIECLAIYRAANKESEKDRRSIYRAENKEAFAARTAAYQAANRSRISARQSAWYAANRESAAENIRVWQASNPHKKRAIVNARRAGKRGIPGRYTAAEVDALLISQNHFCAAPHCNADLRVTPKHLDHITPLSRPELNPTNSIENLQWLCQPCNSSKGAKTMGEWLRL